LVTTCNNLLQLRVWGADRIKFLETIVVGDIRGLKEDHSCLSLMTNKKGGIVDDTVITDAGDHYYMVINGATKITDMKHLMEQIRDYDGYVHIDALDPSHQLLALQGSGAATALQPLLPPEFDLSKMPFMTGMASTIDDVEHCRVTRYVAVFLCTWSANIFSWGGW
jgi:aminomethyltransferase